MGWLTEVLNFPRQCSGTSYRGLVKRVASDIHLRGLTTPSMPGNFQHISTSGFTHWSLAWQSGGRTVGARAEGCVGRCLQIRRGACYKDDSHCDRLQRNRAQGFGKKNGADRVAEEARVFHTGIHRSLS